MSREIKSAAATLEALSDDELALVDGGITTTQFYCGVLGIASGMFVGTALSGATFGLGGPVAGAAGALVGTTVAGVCMEMLDP